MTVIRTELHERGYVEIATLSPELRQILLNGLDDDNPLHHVIGVILGGPYQSYYAVRTPEGVMPYTQDGARVTETIHRLSWLSQTVLRLVDIHGGIVNISDPEMVEEPDGTLRIQGYGRTWWLQPGCWLFENDRPRREIVHIFEETPDGVLRTEPSLLPEMPTPRLLAGYRLYVLSSEPNRVLTLHNPDAGPEAAYCYNNDVWRFISQVATPAGQRVTLGYATPQYYPDDTATPDDGREAAMDAPEIDSNLDLGLDATPSDLDMDGAIYPSLPEQDPHLTALVNAFRDLGITPAEIPNALREFWATREAPRTPAPAEQTRQHRRIRIRGREHDASGG